MTKDVNEMTEAELAEFYYANRDDLDGDEVAVDVVHPVSVTMSFRVPSEEAASIRAAVSESGLSLSEWLREACDLRVRLGNHVVAVVGGAATEQPPELARLQREATDLSEHLNRLIEATRHASLVQVGTQRSAQDADTPG